MVDIECDGAPFHRDDERDAERDRALRDGAGQWCGSAAGGSCTGLTSAWAR